MKNGPKLIRNLFFYALKQNDGSLSLKLLDSIIFSQIRRKLGGNLRLMISGGASLNLTIAKFFKKIGIKILEGYGLTETSPVLAVNTFENFKLGTVGKPIPGVEIKIDSEHEILARGPMIMSGYYKNRQETEAVIDDSGWFHTGDLGFLDKDGFLTIVGRKKEMMVTSGGKNIWPEPLEQLLNIDKYISQSVVIANNRKFVSALIIPDWQEINNYLESKHLPSKNKEDIVRDLDVIKLFQERINQINSKLPEYEQIKKFHLLTDELSEAKEELTPTLKLRRQIIEANYKKQIESMYQ